MENIAVSDPAASSIRPDLGIPTARNARIYAIAGLAVTAVVGLVIWDLLGLILGLPLAILGLIRGGMSLRLTRAYPRDRRAAITAIAAGLVALALVIPIVISASNSEDEPVDCGNNQACLDRQQSGE